MAESLGTWDYIIVGAGSAGCVLAARLTEDGRSRVLLLEAGGSERSIWTRIPAGLTVPMNTRRFNWGLSTEPEPNLGGRRVNLPRGKGLGGSSTINGMCYVRGNPGDYDNWVSLGATGWSYANCLPYFNRAESYAGPPSPWRGKSGPLATTRGKMHNPLVHAFILAGAQAGYALTEDMNGPEQEGFAPMDMTVGGGERSSAATAYLRPAMSRGNLTVMTQSLAECVEFSGIRARSVMFRRRGRVCRARAEREVILAAGSIMTPKLMKLSGLGPAKEVAELGLPVTKDLPGVGENLCDHLELYIQMGCREPVSIAPALTPFGKLKVGAQWFFFKRGLGATNHFEAGAFVRSGPSVPYPDIQFHFLPLAISYDGKSLQPGHGFQVHVGTKRSKSRGRVWLASSDPLVPPKVLFNYMSQPEDWTEMRSCIRIARDIFAQPAFDAFRRRELAPGAEVQDELALDDFIRRKVESAYHPCGTCRMGNPSDAMVVVDPDLCVKGMSGLRIVDASVMPHATAGDLNAPTTMIAERAADLIRGRPMETADPALVPEKQIIPRPEKQGTPMRCHL